MACVPLTHLKHTLCAHILLQNTLSRVNGTRAIDSSRLRLVHTCYHAVRTVCAIDEY